jgi:hypothetical protein
MEFDYRRMSLDPVHGVQDLNWPMRARRLVDFRDACMLALLPHARARVASGDPIGSILLPHLVQELMHAYRGYFVASRLRSTGKTANFHPGFWLDAAMNGAVPDPERAPFVVQLKRGPLGSRFRNMAGALNARLRWRQDRLPRATGLRSFRNRRVALGESRLISTAAKICGGEVVNAPWIAFIRGLNAPPASESWHDEWIEIALDAMGPDVALARDKLRKFLRHWFARTTPLLAAYRDDLRRRAGSLPAELWTVSGAPAWTGLLRAAVRENGGKVLAFDHGSGHGPWRFDGAVGNEFAFADQLVTFSEPMAALYSEFDHRFRLENSFPRIATVSAPWATSERPANGAHRPRVLLMTVPLMGERWLHMAPMHADPVQADWQIRAIGMLRSLGFDVTVKVHPEWPDFADTISRVTNAAVELRTFEGVVGEYDVIVYDYPWTSTFVSAITSGLATVLINFDLFELRGSIAGQFDLRVAMINGSIEENGRLNVCPEALRAAIYGSIAKAGSASLSALYPASAGMAQRAA